MSAAWQRQMPPWTHKMEEAHKLALAQAEVQKHQGDHGVSVPAAVWSLSGQSRAWLTQQLCSPMSSEHTIHTLILLPCSTPALTSLGASQNTPWASASPQATKLCAATLTAQMTTCHPHQCHGHCTQNSLEAALLAASGLLWTDKKIRPSSQPGFSYPRPCFPS